MAFTVLGFIQPTDKINAMAPRIKITPAILPKKDESHHGFRPAEDPYPLFRIDDFCEKVLRGISRRSHCRHLADARTWIENIQAASAILA